MDSVNYRIYNQQIGEWRYLIDQSVTWSFVNDLVTGTLTGFSVSGLFQNNSDYVVGITYYPIKINLFANIGASQTTMKIGSLTANYSCKPVTSQISYIELCNFTLTKHFNNFLDYEPYTRVTLHVPFFDDIPIPLYKSSYNDLFKYYVYMAVDVNSGKATLYVRHELKIIAMKETQIGYPIAIGKSNKEEQIRNNILQAISGIGSGIGLYLGVASGNPLLTGASVGLLTKNITSAISNNVDRITGYSASNGNRSSLAQDKTIFLSIERPDDSTFIPNAHLKGKPCKQNLALSGVSGYTEIGEIHFNPDGYEIYDDEINEIVELLKSGVILP